jgi:anti-anti-sigma factor
VGSHRSAPVEFGVAIESLPDRMTVTLSGHADEAAAKVVEAALRDVVRDHDKRDVELALGELAVFDPRVLGVVLGARAELERQGRTLRVVAVSAEAARLLERMGVDQVLDLRHDPDD